jgi:hypothetical protein
LYQTGKVTIVKSLDIFRVTFFSPTLSLKWQKRFFVLVGVFGHLQFDAGGHLVCRLGLAVVVNELAIWK